MSISRAEWRRMAPYQVAIEARLSGRERKVESDRITQVTGERKDADEVRRKVREYLTLMGTPECCTVETACERHRGALRGRDADTGEYL
jgi:hypothetical protein